MIEEKKEKIIKILKQQEKNMLEEIKIIQEIESHGDVKLDIFKLKKISRLHNAIDKLKY